jgi:hypothetical protein
MTPFERLRDNLRAEQISYQLLDAAQLVKHSFGLTTQARRSGLKPVLVYLFAEPATLAGRAIEDEARRLHREEIKDFAARVAGADVTFHALSYREWIASWTGAAEVIAHGRAVLATFAP